MNGIALTLAALLVAQTPPAPRPNRPASPAPAARPAAAPARPPGLYATLTTSMGTIVCRLFEKEAPLAVANFTALARGTREWTDPTGQKVKRPLYAGTIFHRVIPDFMIQGGDPRGDGYGDPGYKFKDEFSPTLRFDRPGILAMANAGPDTNGSQFFITDAPTPFLNGKHTIFGEVVAGLPVVLQIARVPRDPANDRPRTPVVLKAVRIARVGGAAAGARAPTARKTAPAGAAPKKPAP